MILVGNGEPVTLTRNNDAVWLLSGIVLLIAIVLLTFIIHRKSKRAVY